MLKLVSITKLLYLYAAVLFNANNYLLPNLMQNHQFLYQFFFYNTTSGELLDHVLCVAEPCTCVSNNTKSCILIDLYSEVMSPSVLLRSYHHWLSIAKLHSCPTFELPLFLTVKPSVLKDVNMQLQLFCISSIRLNILYTSSES